MSERSWTALELVRWTTGYLAEHGVASPRLDAELLLGHVLGLPRIKLYTGFDRPVDADERARFRELVRRRAKERAPVAYLTGTREFWSLTLHVTPDVLIPRPETETLVRAVLALEPGRVVEFGTGSGAVAAALASELADAEIVAIDCSAPALEIARRNLDTLGLLPRVTLLLADTIGAAPGRYDLAVSNPPYVPAPLIDGLAPELAHEPRLALDGGPDGLDAIRRLCAEAPACLAPGGHLALEVGEGQAKEVDALLCEAGAKDVSRTADLQGVERVLIARF